MKEFKSHISAQYTWKSINQIQACPAHLICTSAWPLNMQGMQLTQADWAWGRKTCSAVTKSLLQNSRCLQQVSGKILKQSKSLKCFGAVRPSPGHSSWVSDVPPGEYLTGPSSAKAAWENLGSHTDYRAQLLSDTSVYGTACWVFLVKH